MPLTMRTIITAAVPTLAALFGIFWFRRKKKNPSIDAPKVEDDGCKSKEALIRVDTGKVCNSAPHVFVTQPSQATPKEESFDVTEALAKAAAESINEASEEKGESDSEEESIESVVTAIEASTTSAVQPTETDIGVIEDACLSSSASSELNTPSPVEALEKLIVVEEAVTQATATPVQAALVDKVEDGAIIEPPLQNEIIEKVESQNCNLASSVEIKPTENVGAHFNEKCINKKPEKNIHQLSDDLTNGEHNTGSAEIAHVTNGKLENGIDTEDTSPGAESPESHSLSWSETIELSENNNTDKAGEEICLNPFHTSSSSSKVTDSSHRKKSSPSAKLSPSASKSQGNVSSKYQTSKQSKHAGSSGKVQKVSEGKKSPRSNQTSRGRDQHNGVNKKGKNNDSWKVTEETNGYDDHMDDEDSSEWGHQAEALPNGVHSDAHSEVSVDSGKASSVSETPSAASPNHLPEFVVYEFDFPTDYCGRLIGRSGKNVNQLKAKSGAEISLKRKPFTMDYQICSVEGTQSQVNAAIELMKQRFPPRQFPGITWEQLNVETSPILPPEIMQLSLPEGVSVDVIVSSVVDANHVFVQQPTHPTYSSLERLLFCMNSCYTQDSIVPQLPRPIDAGVICAAPMYQGWFRAQIVAYDEETDECDIKFVDYGGYLRVKSSILRQIRSDFTTLPFQATEVYMAHVVPLKDEESFAPDAAALLESMVQNQLLQAQILSHEEDGVPYIQLYKIQADKVFFVNRELVNQNVARWIEMS